MIEAQSLLISRARGLALSNCAGRECGDREECRRYRARLVLEKKMENGVERGLLAWASFDVERALLGTCASLVPWRGEG